MKDTSPLETGGRWKCKQTYSQSGWLCLWVWELWRSSPRGGCRAPSDHARPQGRIVVTLPCSTLACRSPVRAVNATVTCSTRSRCPCYRGGFTNNFWPSCHAANCALMCSSAAASVLNGPSCSFRPLPHVTATYQKPSAFFRACATGGKTRSVSIQSMPKNVVCGQR